MAKPRPPRLQSSWSRSETSQRVASRVASRLARRQTKFHPTPTVSTEHEHHLLLRRQAAGVTGERTITAVTSTQQPQQSDDPTTIVVTIQKCAASGPVTDPTSAIDPTIDDQRDAPGNSTTEAVAQLITGSTTVDEGVAVLASSTRVLSQAGTVTSTSLTPSASASGEELQIPSVATDEEEDSDAEVSSATVITVDPTLPGQRQTLITLSGNGIPPAATQDFGGNAASKDQDDATGLSGSEIAGVVIGGLALLGLIGALVVLFIKRRRQRRPTFDMTQSPRTQGFMNRLQGIASRSTNRSQRSSASTISSESLFIVRPPSHARSASTEVFLPPAPRVAATTGPASTRSISEQVQPDRIMNFKEIEEPVHVAANSRNSLYSESEVTTTSAALRSSTRGSVQPDILAGDLNRDSVYALDHPLHADGMERMDSVRAVWLQAERARGQ